MKPLVVFATLTLCFGPIEAASAPKYGPGVTATEIKLGQTVPYSGTASQNGIPTGHAMQAIIRRTNDEGGINGRKINLLSLDDAFSPAKTVEQTRRLVESDEVLAITGSFGSAPNAAVQKYLNSKMVPQLFILTGSSRFLAPKEFHGPCHLQCHRSGSERHMAVMSGRRCRTPR